MADRLFGLTGSQMGKLRDIRRAHDAPPPPPGGPTGRIPRDDVPGFWAKITDYEAFGDNQNRYYYAWTQQRRTNTGWEDWPDGISGTLTERSALNSVEAYNTHADGPQGNSLDTSTEDLVLEPVQGDPVVWMVLEWGWNGEEWQRAYTFSYVNAFSCVE